MRLILVGFTFMVAFMLGVPVLLYRSAARRRLRLRRTGRQLVMRMPRGHNAILGTLAVLPCATFAGVALAVQWKPGAEWNGWVLAAFMGLLGALAGGYLFALEARGRILLDEATVEKVGAVTRIRARWEEVVRLSFNPVNRWFFLTLMSGAKLYVAEGLDGISDFAELALQRLPAKVLEESPDAAEELRDLAREQV